MGADGGGTGSLETRVLVLAPTQRDTRLIGAVLDEAGITSRFCHDVPDLCAAALDGAGALMLNEEALAEDGGASLATLLGQQPSWSDLPLLILTTRGADSPRVARAVATLGNVTLLERPTRVAALISAVRSALRARQRQYELRGHLAEHERTAASLREVDRRKDEFLAMLAHELRNPLAPIRNSLYLLREAGDDRLAIDAVRARMERQVDIIVRLVDDLLEVSRITRGQIELRPESIDLAAVLDAAVETSRPAIDSAGHELRLSVPPGALGVRGDPVRLAQVFANLLNNAAKYTDRGGRIDLGVERAGRELVVSVRDTGMGIRPEMLRRVFEMFTQADGARDRAPGGLGIGLTLVRRLVELHGGRVEARSEGPGCGSEFIVRLPAAPAVDEANGPADGRDGAAVAVSVAPATGASRSLRVLVVDDNHDAADSLALLLRLSAGEVRVAHSGQEALELLGGYRPDVALLDIGMPGMSGYELAARIRRRPELQPIVLIALTGWGQDDDRRRSHEAGFDHHLVKPVAPRTLQSLLGSLRASAEAAG